MNIIEIVGGVLLLLTVVLATILCMMQDQNRDQNMTSAITGASNDSFYGKNAGRTKEAILSRFTWILLIVFFVATLLVNILPIYIKF
ncbi:preprotein translocase subunit SecG [Ruminococcus sp.]|uniref:preprotein translocase subunit SecG n=1 Tax=Ruminococcus sp. TaxID=41978 RepID=UPI00262EF7D8|nr:preprotein translocase subunit SecG [Ruminococcus sp.]MDD7555125.1 preprotein translocase subunit SecG [Ruminococcus sp.]MDY4964389.1 preprotein translocase subunit SecG [Ruminococcus callidus]